MTRIDAIFAIDCAVNGLSSNERCAHRRERSIAPGRCNWTFAGSDVRDHRAAALSTLIETAKLDRVGSQDWVADVLSRLPDHPVRRIDPTLPCNWTQPQLKQIAA